MKYLKNSKKKSNSNPFKSLFEVERFLRKISNIKNAVSIIKKSKKFHN